LVVLSLCLSVCLFTGVYFLARSRRDDLESVGYTVLYMLSGSLPWSRITGRSQAHRFDRVGRVKVSTTTAELCRGLPIEIKNYFTYVRSLSFSAPPDYAYLMDLCTRYLQRVRFEWSGHFDWRTTSSEGVSHSSASTSSVESTSAAAEEEEEEEEEEAGERNHEDDEGSVDDDVPEKFDEHGSLIGGDLPRLLRHVVFELDLGM
jgi:hypothetical protein